MNDVIERDRRATIELCRLAISSEILKADRGDDCDFMGALDDLVTDERPAVTCYVCGRTLSAKRSLRRGAGPSCHRRESCEPYLDADIAEARRTYHKAHVILMRGSDGNFIARQGGAT